MRVFQRLCRARIADDGYADTNRRILEKLGHLQRLMEYIMSNFDDLKSALAGIGDKVTTVKTDVETLLAKLTDLQNNPPSGMTPEQQASLDDAVTTAQGIAESLGAIDAEANPPAAAGS